MAGLDRVGHCTRGIHLSYFVSHSLSTLNQYSQEFFFPGGNNFTSVSLSAADINPKPPSCKCMSLENAFNHCSPVCVPLAGVRTHLWIPLLNTAQPEDQSLPGCNIVRFLVLLLVSCSPKRL